MPTVVKCPHPGCGTSCSIADGLTNQAVRCPRCGKPFVPASVAATVAADTSVVGRYQTRAKLGAGAFGTVYRAYDPQLDREVALKLLKPEALSSPQAVERFRREARAAAKMLHPNIVPVHDAGTHGDSHYIASAFIPGKTLAALIPEGGLEPHRAAALALQLADALAYAHGQNVLHRDVKPANILVDGRDHLYLMDFGLAGSIQQERNRMTRLGAVMGTPSYMPPEQAAGDTPNVGPAADQYAAGVVLYELLTGRTPFEGPTEIVLFNVLKTQPKPPSALRPGIDPALEAICLRAMAKKPADRFPDTAAFAAALREWLAEHPPTTVGTSPAKVRRSGLAPTLPTSEMVRDTVPTPGAKKRTAARRSTVKTSSRTADDGGTLVEASATGKGRRGTRLLLWSLLGAALLAGGAAAYFKWRTPAPDDRRAGERKPDAGDPPRDSPHDPAPDDLKADDVPPGFEQLRRDAENGSAAAQFQLGHSLENGAMGFRKDARRALTWYRRAADQGNALGQSHVGNCYYFGIGVDRDYGEAVKWFLLAAEQNEPMALARLGECYRLGQGVTQNDVKAADCHLRAAKLGVSTSQFMIGRWYAEGKGVEKNLALAREWLQKAADQKVEGAAKELAALDAAVTVLPEAERLWLKDANAGDKDAQFELGWAYLYGEKGVTKDEKKGFAWLRKSADQGNVRAMTEAGWCYRNGIGVERHLPESIRLLKAAADTGFARAQQNLGWSYETGQGVPQDYDIAAGLYEKAAAQKDPWGQYLLGNCYADGKGVKANHEKAVALWKLAAAQNLTDAKKALEGYAWAKNKVLPEAERLYRKDADAGDARAQFELGWSYLNGRRHVPRDPVKAVGLLRSAAGQGNADAQDCLGYCYLNGLGVDRDDVKAAELFRKAVDQGNASACCNLGFCLLKGLGVKEDLVEGARLMRVAADQGIATAEYQLGNCYADGKGVKQDAAEAVRWWKKAAEQGNADAKKALETVPAPKPAEAEADRLYRKAAEQGDADAQHDLAWAYLAGTKGMKQDEAEGFRWLRKAAAQGHLGAQNSIGYCYLNGKGVPREAGEAVRWFRMAADAGSGAAQSNLGWCCLTGTGLDADPVRAVELFRLAAGQGDAISEYLLGNCYDEGKGVTKDAALAAYWWRKAAGRGNADARKALATMKPPPEKPQAEADRLYRKAAEQGGLDSQNRLGRAYLYGENGLPQDYAEAVRWIRKAAEKGQANAQGQLALCYAEGKGVARDAAEAVRWYRKAADQDDWSAVRNLGVHTRDGWGTPRDEKEAARLFRKAADHGDATAQYLLGNCCAEGKGVDKDAAEAVRWWKKAAEQGHADAKKALAAQPPPPAPVAMDSTNLHGNWKATNVNFVLGVLGDNVSAAGAPCTYAGPYSLVGNKLTLGGTTFTILKLTAADMVLSTAQGQTVVLRKE